MKAKKNAKLPYLFFVKGLFLVLVFNLPSEISALETKLQSGNSISGMVFGIERQPVSDVDVELLNEFSALVGHTRTSAAGRYSFNNLRAGRYNIHVLPFITGYEEQTQEYEIVNFLSRTSGGVLRASGFDNAQVDFYLKPRRSNKEDNGIVGAIFVQDVPNKAKSAYKKALDSIDRKDDQKSLSYLKEALNIFPDYYLALERLGTEYFRLKQFENARDTLGKAVTINPRGYSAWYSLAQSLFLLKNFVEAIDASQKAVELAPSSINAYIILSVSLKENGRYNDAETQLKKANKVAKGEDAEVHWQLAKLYADKFKLFEKAADELEVFLKIDPNNFNAEKIKRLIQSFREKAKSVNK